MIAFLLTKTKFRETCLLALFLFTSFVVEAQECVVASPNGELSITLNFSEGVMNYSVRKNQTALLNQTPISITLEEVTYPTSSGVTYTSVKSVSETLTPELRIKAAQFQASYKEVIVEMSNQVRLRVRVYDDAVTFRWEVDRADSEVIVNAEEYSLNFADKKLSGWLPSPNGEGYFSHQECIYVYKAINKGSAPLCVPMLVDLKNNQLMLVTDVNVDHYPGLWLSCPTGGSFTFDSPHYPKRVELFGDRSMKVAEYEDYIAKVPGKSAMPWRVMLVTTARGLLESQTLYALAEPNRIGDTSWIKPGKVAWDWWNQFLIDDVDFRPGINQATYLHYIDFAAANGLPYVLIDDGWCNSKPDRFLELNGDLDIQALVEYAEPKGVRIILWASSTCMEANFDRAFDRFEQWGVAGLKMDFMQRDDQMMNAFCTRVAQRAAEKKMICVFHGGSKPTGMQRTYPNVLNHESVMGMEQSLWNTKANPNMALMNAFVRMSVGPMDYTPGAMNNQVPSSFVPAKEVNYLYTSSMGTRCQQLAMYVVYNAPLQMLCDSPSSYRKNPRSMEFLREVPTEWDETVVIDALPCQYLAVAKRNGKRWFVGCMNDTTLASRTLQLSMNFLPVGKNYTLKSWADGPNADKDGKDHLIREQLVNSTSVVPVTMAKGGGFAAILEEGVPSTSVESSLLGQGVLLFPTAFDNRVIIQGARERVEVYDVNGRCVQSVAVSGDLTEIETHSLSQGCYFFVVDQQHRLRAIRK